MNFKKIKWKNFFSYGKCWTEIDLDQKKIIGIFGENGSGKSIILDALYFVMTGKSFRNKLKKSQLINTTNKKNCVVELELSKGKDIYKIKRGIKPDIFEVIKNDTPLDETAHVRDFQTMLEQIFSFNPKVLKNTLFMSSMDYSPFLLFTLAEKREFIENILNLQIYGNMLDNLKIDLSIIKKDIQEINFRFQLIEKKLTTIREMNKLIENKQKSNKSDINSQISTLKEEIDKIAILLFRSEKTLFKNQTFYDKKHDKYIAGINKDVSDNRDISGKIDILETKINREVIEIQKENTLKNFFISNHKCHTCKQKINKKHKTQIIFDINERITSAEFEIKEIKFQIHKHKIALEKLKDTKQKIYAFGEKNTKFYDEKVCPEKLKIQDMKTEIYSSEHIIKSHQKLLKDMETEDVLKDVSEEEDKKRQIEKKQFKKNEEEKIISLSKNLLSDKGIKLFIVEKYIPLLNKYVNNFLDLMGASYRLKFDNTLREQVVLRGYENLSYYSFSSGEKQRCDLALLFAFLKISKIKNSFDCNLLILDEIIGNSLDYEGIKGVMSILQSFKNDGKTIFVISHMDNIKNSLDDVYNCDKKIFSRINK